MRKDRKKERDRSEGMDLDLLLMVLFLVLALTFDKTTAPVEDVALDTTNSVGVVHVVDDTETIIEWELIEETNYASDKVIEDENEYIYSVGDVLDIELEGEIIHFVVLDIVDGDAKLREIGVQNGKELTLKDIKNQQ